MMTVFIQAHFENNVTILQSGECTQSFHCQEFLSISSSKQTQMETFSKIILHHYQTFPSHLLLSSYLLQLSFTPARTFFLFFLSLVVSGVVSACCWALNFTEFCHKHLRKHEFYCNLWKKNCLTCSCFTSWWKTFAKDKRPIAWDMKIKLFSASLKEHSLMLPLRFGGEEC